MRGTNPVRSLMPSARQRVHVSVKGEHLRFPLVLTANLLSKPLSYFWSAELLPHPMSHPRLPARTCASAQHCPPLCASCPGALACWHVRHSRQRLPRSSCSNRRLWYVMLRATSPHLNLQRRQHLLSPASGNVQRSFLTMRRPGTMSAAPFTASEVGTLAAMDRGRRLP